MLTPIPHFLSARRHPSPQNRLDAVINASLRFRENMLRGPKVTYYRSFDLVRLPYPLKYALRDACAVPIPFIAMVNRLFVIQFNTDAGLKTLLVSPSDVTGNRLTPFFKRLAERFRFLGQGIQDLLTPVYNTVESCLVQIDLSPERVDFITYDHLHTQELRRWLGSDQNPGYFCNAKLLVTRQEWASTHALIPPQRDWYCPDGTLKIPTERVVIFDGDVCVGQGVALIATPGHTEGNHSIVAHTDEGLLVTSENGVAADSYSPSQSRIPGLKKYAQATGMEVVLNGNTLEGSIDQYISMMQERTIAGFSKRNPHFYNVVPSSELASLWLAPLLKPTFSFGEIEYGTLVK